MPETQSGIDTKQNTKLGAILEVVIQWHSLYIATDSGHTYHQLASLYLVGITKKSIF